MTHQEGVYKGARCKWDGTRMRFRGTYKCVECTIYANAIKAGRIDGIKGNPLIRTPMYDDNWCEEMSKERSNAIKRGLARRKATHDNPPP